MEKFSDQLRQAILDCGISRYALSVRTGVDQGTLSKFLKGGGGCPLTAIDKVMDVMGLEIRPRRKRKDG